MKRLKYLFMALVLLLVSSPTATQALAPVIVPIGTISKTQLDKYITIKGTVREAGNFSVGFKFVIADDTGKIAVTYFEDTYDQLPKPALLRVGAYAQITGKLKEYQGEFELTPNRAKETLVLTPTATVSGTVMLGSTRDLGSLNNGDHGATVQVSGEVFSVETFDNGSDVVISDKTGAQKIRLWNVVLKRVSKDALVKGTKLNVIGKVRASKKQGLRVEPALPFDVTVVK